MQGNYSFEFVEDLGAYIQEQEKLLKRLNKQLANLEGNINALESNLQRMQRVYNTEMGIHEKPELKRIK